jgi:hypothetical protein
MRNLSVLLIIASLMWLTGPSSGGRNAHPAWPGVSGGLQTAGPSLPIIPLGDDAGGSH